VAGTSYEELVSYAAELERHDGEVAEELATLADVAERAASLRARAAEIRDTFERLPHELDDLSRRERAARADVAAADGELRRAEERVAALSRARRRKQDELDRAEREASTARDLRDDSRAEVERLRERAETLRDAADGLRTDAETLSRQAKAIAEELVRIRRLPDAPGLRPGDALTELEEWGLLVRSAVLVARGTLEAERERIVVEANALAAGALGEPLSGANVALVRRRLEELASL
jgi:DNA repair exonuclease SbcCD ATPase subunit